MSLDTTVLSSGRSDTPDLSQSLVSRNHDEQASGKRFKRREEGVAYIPTTTICEARGGAVNWVYVVVHVKQASIQDLKIIFPDP